MAPCIKCGDLRKVIAEKEQYIRELEDQLDRMQDEKLRERGSSDDRYGGY